MKKSVDASDKPRILIADDEQSMREWMRLLFQRDGFEVLTAEDGLAARDLVTREYVDVVLTDIRMPRLDGVKLMHAVRELAPDANGFAGIIGRSAAMLEVFRLVEMVCRTNSTVLLSGESGTGKELVARAIHELSLRRARPFVAVNCGAMPEALLESELFGHVRGAFTGADKDKKGLIEAAEGGTVFLDEIGEMPPPMQVKLLRVLQERHYRPVGATAEAAADIRVIAATNRDLAKRVAEGQFREDLFYRLNVIPLKMPPLRERVEDIPLIADHFLRKYMQEMNKLLDGFAPEALTELQAYSWPGNVRELENVVERAVALESGRRVGASTLPQNVREGRPATHHANGEAAEAAAGFNLERHLQDIERSHLERALERAGGMQTRAADALGLSFRQFRYLAKKYGLK
jgi:two-component system response regulator PilR (NtrC family)